MFKGFNNMLAADLLSRTALLGAGGSATLPISNKPG